MTQVDTSGAPASASDSEAAALEKRITRLEDVRAIQEVIFRYKESTDTEYDLGKIASASTPAGRW